MGEQCLRWILRLNPDEPLVWPSGGTRSMQRIRQALEELDDEWAVPRLSVTFIAERTGISDIAVRAALKRLRGQRSARRSNG